MHFDASLYIGEIFLHPEGGSITCTRAPLRRARFASERRPLSDCDSSGRIHGHGGPSQALAKMRRCEAPRSLAPLAPAS